MKRILIIKTSSLGDVIQTIPVAFDLKKKLNAEIDWLVERRCGELLFQIKALNQVITFEKKDLKNPLRWASLRKQLKGYDVVFDLQGNTKSALLTAMTQSKVKVGFGKKSVSEWPNLWVTNHKIEPCSSSAWETYLELPRRYFNLTNQKVAVELSLPDSINQEVDLFLKKFATPLVLCFPFSRWSSKQVDLNELSKTLSKIAEKKVLFFWSTEQEKFCLDQMKSIPNGLIMTHKVSMLFLYALFQKVSGIITMDSMPLHLAGLTETPTFAFFGASSKQYYLPQNKQGIQGHCPFGYTFKKRCPQLRSCVAQSCIKQFDEQTMLKNLHSFFQGIKDHEKDRHSASNLV